MERILAWNLTKVRNKKGVIDEARNQGRKVDSASLMDIRRLENAELETKHQKYEGPVVFRGDIVKDNSGSYAVFSEQGPSASQMTAAKIMDIISRLPGFDGQAADAVSAYTQVKLEDAHKLLKIPKPKCPDIWIRLPRHKWPKSWSSMEDPVVLLERNLHGHPLEGLFWETQFEKILLKYGWEMVFNRECLFVHRQKEGVNSLTHCNLVHKFIPMPQSIQNTGCQGSSGKRMRKIGGNSGMAADESQKRKRGDR